MKSITQKNEELLENLRNLFERLYKLFCEGTEESYSEAYRLTLRAIIQASPAISYFAPSTREILEKLLSRLNQITKILETPITPENRERLKELSNPQKLPSIQIPPKVETLEEAKEILKREWKKAIQERNNLAKLIVQCLFYWGKEPKIFFSLLEEIKNKAPLLASAVQQICDHGCSSIFLKELLFSEEEGWQ